jgi:cytochrome P450
VELDLVQITTKLQNHIITDILLGAGNSFKKMTLTSLDGVDMEVTLGGSMDILVEQGAERVLKNPLVLLHPSLLQMQLTKVDALFHKNALTVRGSLEDIINERKKQLDTSKPAKDIISLMLLDDYYSTHMVELIDDIIVMFIAGTKTVQGTTTNFITQYIVNEDLRTNFHAETDPLCAKVGHDFVKEFTFEMTDDLDYVRMAYNEVMRMDVPFAITGFMDVLSPTNFKGIHIEPGQAFLVHTRAMHNDPEQWIEPEKFIPERFSPESPYYKRPDGGRRNPLAFSPFLGGHRICLGKTFAEVVLKFTLPMYCHFFSFEFANKEHYEKRPVYAFKSKDVPVIPVNFTTKNKVQI